MAQQENRKMHLNVCQGKISYRSRVFVKWNRVVQIRGEASEVFVPDPEELCFKIFCFLVNSRCIYAYFVAYMDICWLICIYAGVYAYMHICLRYVHMCICIYAGMYAFMLAYMHICSHICIYAYMSAYMHICQHLCNTCPHVCIYGSIYA